MTELQFWMYLRRPDQVTPRGLVSDVGRETNLLLHAESWSVEYTFGMGNVLVPAVILDGHAMVLRVFRTPVQHLHIGPLFPLRLILECGPHPVVQNRCQGPAPYQLRDLVVKVTHVYFDVLHTLTHLVVGAEARFRPGIEAKVWHQPGVVVVHLAVVGPDWEALVDAEVLDAEYEFDIGEGRVVQEGDEGAVEGR